MPRRKTPHSKTACADMLSAADMAKIEAAIQRCAATRGRSRAQRDALKQELADAVGYARGRAAPTAEARDRILGVSETTVRRLVGMTEEDRTALRIKRERAWAQTVREAQARPLPWLTGKRVKPDAWNLDIFIGDAKQAWERAGLCPTMRDDDTPESVAKIKAAVTQTGLTPSIWVASGSNPTLGARA
jgi:hypothetical protein